MEEPKSIYSKADYVRLFILLVFVLGVVGSYLYVFRSNPLSQDPNDWGVFGDYIGGLLNPVVATFALILLWISVGIQRKELKATREALDENVIEQRNILKTNNVGIRVQAIASKLNSLHLKMDVLSRKIEFAQQRLSGGERVGLVTVYDVEAERKVEASVYIVAKQRELKRFEQAERICLTDLADLNDLAIDDINE
jgi:hypothetical protein